jgi:hypothetical protein
LSDCRALGRGDAANILRWIPDRCARMRSSATSSTDWRDANVSVLSQWFRYRLPNFGAAVGALIDEVDPGHAPMGLDFPDVHGE